MTGGTTHTGVLSIERIWYRFVLEVEDQADLGRTAVRAKVWQEGTSEPATWQAVAYDDSPGRRTSGTVGVWSKDKDKSRWDDLEVIADAGSCDDGDPCTIDSCSAGDCGHDPVDCAGYGDACNDASCDPLGAVGNCDVLSPINIGGPCSDDQYCNGEETCDAAGLCQPGTPPDCDDGVDCTNDTCDEAGDTCIHTPVTAFCDNGLYCDGEETCDPVLDCVASAAPCAGTEWCHEDPDQCIALGDGDSEPDGDIDLEDFARFQQCFGQLGLDACQPVNMTGDGEVDLGDFEAFAPALDASGPE
jgi:hypothetical protein